MSQSWVKYKTVPLKNSQLRISWCERWWLHEFTIGYPNFITIQGEFFSASSSASNKIVLWFFTISRQCMPVRRLSNPQRKFRLGLRFRLVLILAARFTMIYAAIEPNSLSCAKEVIPAACSISPDFFPMPGNSILVSPTMRISFILFDCIKSERLW